MTLCEESLTWIRINQEWPGRRKLSPQQIHDSVPGEENSLALVHLQGLVKHGIHHAGLGNLVEQFCRLKSGKSLAGLLRTCWHCHVQVEQDGQEVLGIAGKEG